jgi:hypothetical protein
MIDYVRQVLAAQFEAGLCMLHQCVEQCRPQFWEGKIAGVTCRQVAYHTLFFVDLYLSPSEAAFELRELHARGGDEREPKFSLGLEQDETLAYVQICRHKAAGALAAETAESLAGPSGFSWYPVSRGELHLISLRHIQHHTGQLSAYLRRCDPALADSSQLRWVGSGWR